MLPCHERPCQLRIEWRRCGDPDSTYPLYQASTTSIPSTICPIGVSHFALPRYLLSRKDTNSCVVRESAPPPANEIIPRLKKPPLAVTWGSSAIAPRCFHCRVHIANSEHQFRKIRVRSDGRLRTWALTSGVAPMPNWQMKPLIHRKLRPGVASAASLRERVATAAQAAAELSLAGLC